MYYYAIKVDWFFSECVSSHTKYSWFSLTLHCCRVFTNQNDILGMQSLSVYISHHEKYRKTKAGKIAVVYHERAQNEDWSSLTFISKLPLLYIWNSKKNFFHFLSCAQDPRCLHHFLHFHFHNKLYYLCCSLPLFLTFSLFLFLWTPKILAQHAQITIIIMTIRRMLIIIVHVYKKKKGWSLSFKTTLDKRRWYSLNRSLQLCISCTIYIPSYVLHIYNKYSL